MAKIEAKSVLGRLDDGTIQLTITIPATVVTRERERVIDELIKKVQVPGFRPGKAPRETAAKQLDPQDIENKLLQHLLPEVYANAVEEHKLKPILAPRFELVSTKENSDWTIRAITCEVPEVEIEDYKKTIVGEAKAGEIWTPGKSKDKPKEETREQKEQKIIEAIIKNVKAKIPQVLIDEEVNHKLSKLLDQTQKLGLTIEQYLSSTGKTVEQLKNEYSRQAREAITLELALNKIAEAEKIDVTEKDIDEAIAQISDGETAQKLNTPRQRAIIKGVLARRQALDRLVTLI